MLTQSVDRVSWNSTVPYILATASGGVTSVWDLRSNKPWCSLREPNRGRFSDLAWQPDNGLLLMTGALSHGAAHA